MYDSLTQRECALVEYASKLTAEPSSIRQNDIRRLRETGLEDEAILHLVQVVAYFNFVNRIAHGLGVEIEA